MTRRAMLRYMVTLFAVTVFGSVGFAGHMSTQSSMAAMHHEGSNVSSCSVLCSAVKHDDEVAIADEQDDDPTPHRPFYGDQRPWLTYDAKPKGWHVVESVTPPPKVPLYLMNAVLRV